METFAIGPIRPPFHAESLLLQVTENCTWNRCNFCTLYRGGTFHMRTVEEVKKDIDAVAAFRHRIDALRDVQGNISHDAVMEEYQLLTDDWEKECFSMVYRWMESDDSKSVFLQDANTLVLPPAKLAEIVRYLREKLPSLELVASYGRADTLSRISMADYHMLRQAGLTMIHSGYESGSDKVLQLLNKGVTQQQQIEAGQKIMEAGFEFNLFYMPGSGGTDLAEENASQTAKVIRAIDPDYVRIRTFVVKEETPMWQLKTSGAFHESTDIEKVEELRNMIFQLEGCHGYLISDHIINLLPDVEGYLDRDKETMLSVIDGFFALPEKERRQYQLARRLCFGGTYRQMGLLRPEDRMRIANTEQQIRDPEQWEALMHQFLRHYI
ncbi:MAG TPA: radical SAM protein [Firmicutes bacterium]|nr:radical SAM protein [Bacillota bacterium]